MQVVRNLGRAFVQGIGFSLLQVGLLVIAGLLTVPNYIEPQRTGTIPDAAMLRFMAVYIVVAGVSWLMFYRRDALQPLFNLIQNARTNGKETK